MALGDFGNLEELEFPEFSCLCELCDCGRHKHHQNCQKKHPPQRDADHPPQRDADHPPQRDADHPPQRDADCLLSHYQSTFTRPLNIVPRSSKRPERTPPYHNPPAMQCETTQRSEFKPKTLKEQAKTCNREYDGVTQEPRYAKSLHNSATALKRSSRSACSSRSSSDSSTNKNQLPNTRVRRKEPPTTAGSSCCQCQNKTQQNTTQAEIAENSCYRVERGKAMPDTLKFQGVHDLNTTYQVIFQPHPFEKQQTPAKKRSKPKSVPMETVSTYRSDFPLYTPESMRPRTAIPRWDNLHINRSLPAEFSTTQRDSYIGWDTMEHPRPNAATFREVLSEREGTIESDTVTKLTYTLAPFTKLQELSRPMTMQSPCGGKFSDGTVYKNSFKPWDTKSRVRQGDRHDGAYVPPPGKIANVTITKQDFVPKNVCKPKDSVGQPNRSWSTIPREASSTPHRPMCRLQAYLLYQRLKDMKICSRPASVATQ
ncbi:uncharacterized protein [Scyliorhinus torazame]|uniref:uncharacterized protein isoform X2 n=1 Tax=Scyliorhinus torazame TaxID=75743 RepID=UPI003B5BB583